MTAHAHPEQVSFRPMGATDLDQVRTWLAEPHVAEREYNRLVAGERNITLLPGPRP